MPSFYSMSLFDAINSYACIQLQMNLKSTMKLDPININWEMYGHVKFMNKYD